MSQHLPICNWSAYEPIGPKNSDHVSREGRSSTSSALHRSRIHSSGTADLIHFKEYMTFQIVYGILLRSICTNLCRVVKVLKSCRGKVSLLGHLDALHGEGHPYFWKHKHSSTETFHILRKRQHWQNSDLVWFLHFPCSSSGWKEANTRVKL